MTTYRQKGEAEPIRGNIRLINQNQIELKARYRGQLSGNVFYSLTVATRTGAMTNDGAMIFSNAYTEFYINPVDWRRLTGQGLDK